MSQSKKTHEIYRSIRNLYANGTFTMATDYDPVTSVMAIIKEGQRRRIDHNPNTIGYIALHVMRYNKMSLAD